RAAKACSSSRRAAAGHNSTQTTVDFSPAHFVAAAKLRQLRYKNDRIARGGGTKRGGLHDGSVHPIARPCPALAGGRCSIDRQRARVVRFCGLWILRRFDREAVFPRPERDLVAAVHLDRVRRDLLHAPARRDRPWWICRSLRT